MLNLIFNFKHFLFKTKSLFKKFFLLSLLLVSIVAKHIFETSKHFALGIFENVFVRVIQFAIKRENAQIAAETQEYLDLKDTPGTPEYNAIRFKEQAARDELRRREGISGSPEYVAKALREAARRKKDEKKDNILMK